MSEDRGQSPPQKKISQGGSWEVKMKDEER